MTRLIDRLLAVLARWLAPDDEEEWWQANAP